MDKMLELEISEESSVPKYKQIVNSVIDKIVNGELELGQKIPSINEVSFDYYLSRDTVEKAYNELKELNIISSVKSKGYYVTNIDPDRKFRVLLIFNKLSAYKKIIYEAFTSALKNVAIIDLHIHHYDPAIFRNILKENLHRYNYYVLMPHFRNTTPDTLDIVRQIPDNKLLLLDTDLEGLEGEYGAVYQDFQEDIYEALSNHKDSFEKYNRVRLVFPPLNSVYPYPKRIMDGFRKFCNEYKFDFDIFDEIDDSFTPVRGDAYIVIEELDLANLIKKIRAKDMEPGKDVGILSYNDTPLKEVLEKGVSVISTSHEKMGKTAAEMLMSKQMDKVKNPFNMILRNTL